MSKVCSVCERRLPSNSFYKRVSSSDGLRSSCILCENKQSQQDYWKNHQQRKEKSKKYHKTIIGAYKHRFHSMKNRCENPDADNYCCYGGRGIKVLFENAAEFAEYMMNTFDESPIGLEIDRIESNGHYEPGNLRLVTQNINLSNRRKHGKK